MEFRGRKNLVWFSSAFPLVLFHKHGDRVRHLHARNIEEDIRWQSPRIVCCAAVSWSTSKAGAA